MRKLDCVSNQIEENLANAIWVAYRHRGDFFADRAEQLQVFLMRPKRQRLHYFRQHETDIELHRVQFQHAGFDLREVQNVVNDG